MAVNDDVNTAITSLASTIAGAPDAPDSYSLDGQSVSRNRRQALKELQELRQLLSGPFEVTQQGI